MYYHIILNTNFNSYILKNKDLEVALDDYFIPFIKQSMKLRKGIIENVINNIEIYKTVQPISSNWPINLETYNVLYHKSILINEIRIKAKLVNRELLNLTSKMNLSN